MKPIDQSDAHAMLELLHRAAAGEDVCAEALALSSRIVAATQARKPYPQGVRKSVTDRLGNLLRAGCVVTHTGGSGPLLVAKINAKAQTCTLGDGCTVAGIDLIKFSLNSNQNTNGKLF